MLFIGRLRNWHLKAKNGSSLRKTCSSFRASACVHGFDFREGPVHVALQGAVSAAGLLITTEAMVAELPKKQSLAMPGARGRHGLLNRPSREFKFRSCLGPHLGR
jgi:hypothetical protein